MPKVTVILPCYNVESHVAKSIQSVLDQTYTDFELLVIIDGSPDNSRSIAESYTDSRITVFEKENGGLSDARNYGLERAKGEFVYFMDSDDWIEPVLIEKTTAVLDDKQLDIVVFGYIQDNEDVSGNVISSHEEVPTITSLHKADAGKVINTNLLGLLGYAWNKVYRRSFLLTNNLRFEKGTSLVEDILFNSQVYQQVNEIYFIKEAFYHYSNRPSATLIKQYHSDSFNLKLRRNLALQEFFSEWNFDNPKEILAYSQIQGIRYCVHNMFSYKNQLSWKEKLNYISQMVNHPFTRETIADYHPENFNDKLYKLLIKSKHTLAIGIIALLIK